MPRLSQRDAQAIMSDEIQAVGGNYDDRLIRTDGPRAEANLLDWWYEGKVETEGSITPRTIAYLRAYERIAGDLGLQAQGLLLERGRVHMDKYVIRRLHKDAYLTFHAAPRAFFALTQAGRELIAGN